LVGKALRVQYKSTGDCQTAFKGFGETSCKHQLRQFLFACVVLGGVGEKGFGLMRMRWQKCRCGVSLSPRFKKFVELWFLEGGKVTCFTTRQNVTGVVMLQVVALGGSQPGNTLDQLFVAGPGSTGW
jgi:hypothetical protein